MLGNPRPQPVAASPGWAAVWPWWAVAVLAWPVAWGLMRLGFGLPVRDPARDVAWIIGLAAVEELVFRGGLQAWLLQRPAAAWRRSVRGLSMANAATSLAFAAAHLPSQPLPVVLGIVPVSLLLGLAYERPLTCRLTSGPPSGDEKAPGGPWPSRERSGGRLWLPIALHAQFNLALYAASVWQAGGWR